MGKVTKIVLGLLLVMGLAALILGSVMRLRSSRERVEKAASPAAPALLLDTPKTPGNEAALVAAVARNPGDAATLTRLGDFYMTKRSFDRAIATYKRAIGADARYAAAFSALGEAYVQTIESTRTQLPPPAHDAFMKAIAANPADLRARFYLAMEKDFLGQHDEAMNDWIAMLAMVPMGSQADSAIRAAITASMGRQATILRRRVDDATKAQRTTARSAKSAVPVQ